ncbi:hypothetical protein F0U44_05335 [Nocardioides humilatus]|uniref:DUF3558 domain-containing protein n=1 Tax=Nocardioides humilatus TaxID=2607660 RepID=A0A5B1LQ17_9ACTN|nr:hypothetical protein [Nocardioides humilatus]KAA1421697.1 hypothetical protein F0U44_05335 [Nocardioides humilatus]
MRTIRSIVAVFALLLVVSGCGDDDKDSKDSAKDSSDTSGDNTDDTSGDDTGEDTGDDSGDDSGDDTGGALKGGCDYVSDDAASAAMGLPVTGNDSSVGGAAICTYATNDGLGNINVTVKQETGTFDATVAATESVGGPSTPLPGVGDEAAVMGSTTYNVPQGIVIAQAGDKIISVIVTAGVATEDEARAAATAVATEVVANI